VAVFLGAAFFAAFFFVAIVFDSPALYYVTKREKYKPKKSKNVLGVRSGPAVENGVS
jgi:hypothetical protein